MKKKILIAIGTRPEAIKMIPVIKKLQKDDYFKVKICITGQHREMVIELLNLFDIEFDYNLNVMLPNQSLSDITASILTKMDFVLKDFKPNLVLVHGDTTTTFTVALSCYYNQVKVGHVEAGLRTGDIYSPWPEEGNRMLTADLATLSFAPTKKAKENLLKENIPEKNIFITGNTAVDALELVLGKLKKTEIEANILQKLSLQINFNKSILDSKFVLITGHRRENFGKGFKNICEAIKELALKYKDIHFVYVVHLNPNVRKPVKKILSGIKNVHLIEPLDYFSFVYLMKKSYLIMTDSGGIQEEAPSLGKLIMLMREHTERPEGLLRGTMMLVGTNKEKIIDNVSEVFNKKISNKVKVDNPFGDGKASQKIINILKEKL